MTKKLIVLPSARSIRQEQLKQNSKEAIFLPDYLPMGEFISKLTLVENLKPLDEDTRNLLLLEASKFKNFSKLQIEQNFFTFTKNSSYIFKFFEELSGELFDIKHLKDADLYAEYEEHITILEELYKRYENLCLEKKVLDKIFLPKLYKLNSAFLKRYDVVDIFIEGYLTNFELQLLTQSAQFTTLRVHFNTTQFNRKIQKKLQELFNVEFQDGYQYILNFKDLTFEKKEQNLQKLNITLEPLSEPLLEIAFIKQKVFEFVEKGFALEKIVVILPDESKAHFLRIFDTMNNFNFAMGESFTNAKIYKMLDAVLILLEQKTQENFARVKRLALPLYTLLLPHYYKEFGEVDIIALLESFEEFIENDAELLLYKEELFRFEKLLPSLESLNIRFILKLFLQRLAKKSFDDIAGGKITVMGVLEARFMEFDGVIVIDFSDNHIPKKSDKDMFLNSKIRSFAKLPTQQDRQNLQKHYYYMLFHRAKEVALCYVDSDDSKVSKFVKELKLKQNKSFLEKDLASILLQPTKPNYLEQKEIVGVYDFQASPLSATKLKTFLECKRKFYYRYVMQLKNHTIAKDMPQEWEIGQDVHKALKNLYEKRDSYNDVRELQKDLERNLKAVCGESELEKYLIDLQIRKLQYLVHNDIKRFEDGWRVAACEENFKVPYKGFELVGQIDRIDKKENLLTVIDYKTGSYPMLTLKTLEKSTDFQLEFYYLLAAGLGNVQECAYYDLKDSQFVYENLLKEKLALLDTHLIKLTNTKEINFTMCEDLQKCQYCEFSLLCGRGV